MAQRLPLLLVTAAGGALVGGLVGALVASNVSPSSETLRETELRSVEAEQRIVELEERLVEVERRPSRTRVTPREARGNPARASSGDAVTSGSIGPDGQPQPFGGSDAPEDELSEAFVARVRAAIGRIKEQDREQWSEKKHEADRHKTLAEVDRRLRDYQEKLGLTDAQVETFRAAAESAFDKRRTAAAGGATNEQLAALDREKERAYRDVLGSATHREFRKLEIDRAARPVIVDVANRAGVDKEQRDRIETLLSDHIDRLVDPEIRLRTEELDAATRQSIATTLQAANRDAWDRLRGEILTEEQRGRVPVRLR